MVRDFGFVQKATNLTPEEKRLDKYYLKKFGWTLAEVNAMFADQKNVCAACHRPPGERRMSVDHDHVYDRVKITVSRITEGQEHPFHFLGTATDHNGVFYSMYVKTRKDARPAIRKLLRRVSVRGGLCLRCNKGLAMFEDSKAPLPPAERLDNLAAYLRKFQLKNNK